MSENILLENSFSVALAKKQFVGKEWNNIVWDKNHFQIQYHRLYYLTSGEATLHLYDETIRLLPGYIYFIPAFSIKQSEIENNMDKYYIHFQATSPIFELYRYFSNNLYVKGNELTESLFDCITKNYLYNTEASYMKVQGSMNLLLAPFFEEIDTNRTKLVKFKKVLEFIDENYRKKIQLSELASIMNISTMYFSNYFKSVFHISPKQYILNKRMNEAQRLLIESEMSIKEIAFTVGFENESYFSEYFTKRVGVSALKFRNRKL